MAIKLLLGVNNSGKTRYIFNCIKSDLDNNITPLAIVPSQMRLIYEKEYLNETGAKGLLDLDITSFSRLTERYIDEQSITRENYLTRLDKTILLRKLILNNPKIFKVYDKVKNKEGFWSSLDIIIDLLKKEEKNVEELRALNIENSELRYKLNEIIDFYEVFSLELSGKFTDSIDDMQLFLESIKDLEQFKNINIYIDGHNNFSKKELSMILELENVAKNVYISLVTNVKNIEEALSITEKDMYIVANETISIICNRASKLGINVETKSFNRYRENRSKDISYINENLFTQISPDVYNKESNNVKIILKKNPYLEVEEIAKEVASLIRKGYRYKDIGIFVGDLETYKVPIKKIFYDYNLPYYINLKEKIITNSLIIYISSMLETIKNRYDSKSIFKFLKTGLVDITYEDICYIENYVLEYNINYEKKWKRPFIVFEPRTEYEEKIYDEERLNNIREKIITQIDNFYKPFARKNKAEKVAEEIYMHITTGSIFEKYNMQIKDLDKNGMNYFLKIYTQVINKVVDILDSMVRVYGEQEISFDEFCSIFEFSVKEMQLTSFSTNIDELVVSEIGSSRLESKKIIFILGANDEKMPRTIKENLMFSDKDLEELKSTGLDMRETSEDKNLMEEYNVNLAIETALEKLYITYSLAELDGTGLQKSSIITKIEEMLNIKTTSKLDEENITFEDSLYSKKVFTSNCLKAIYNLSTNGALDNTYENWGLVYKEYKTQKMKDILRYIRNQDNLKDETLQLIYPNDKMYMSVSKLEKFNKCAFSYFMQYTLRAKERKVYKVTPADIGDFMHKVIENFSDYISENNRTWHEMLIDNEYTKIVEKISEKVVESNPRVFGDGKKAAALKRQLIRRTRNIIKMIAESFNQSEFVQLGQEIEFKNGGLFAPIEIVLDDGSKMLLTGKIDRVDIYEAEKAVYARVVDYKSSRKVITLDSVREGITLQLMTYMSALISGGEKIISNKKILPAGVLYCTLEKPKLSSADYSKDENKLKQAIINKFKLDGIFISDLDILKKMDKNVEDTKTSRLNITSKRLENSKNMLSEEEFIAECSDIRNTLYSIGKEIKKGLVKINPKNVNDKQLSPCNYCEYGKVCRKNGVC